jgi:hypothetical protein
VFENLESVTLKAERVLHPPNVSNENLSRLVDNISLPRILGRADGIFVQGRLLGNVGFKWTNELKIGDNHR